MNKIKLALWNQLLIWLCGGTLWQRARAWVALYERQDLTGAEKRDQVVAGLTAELQTLGLAVAGSLINLAVEAAVQYLRQTQAHAA